MRTRARVPPLSTPGLTDSEHDGAILLRGGREEARALEQELARALPVAHVPLVDGAVDAAGDERRVVERPRDVRDARRVAAQRLEARRRVRVEDRDDRVVRGREVLAAVREADLQQPRRVSVWCVE